MLLQQMGNACLVERWKTRVFMNSHAYKYTYGMCKPIVLNECHLKSINCRRKIYENVKTSYTQKNSKTVEKTTVTTAILSNVRGKLIFIFIMQLKIEFYLKNAFVFIRTICLWPTHERDRERYFSGKRMIPLHISNSPFKATCMIKWAFVSFVKVTIFLLTRKKKQFETLIFKQLPRSHFTSWKNYGLLRKEFSNEIFLTKKKQSAYILTHTNTRGVIFGSSEGGNLEKASKL